jgi:hypothetical protein
LRNRLLIGLAPERVAAVQLKRGLRPALGVDVVHECAGASDNSAVAPWATALTTLDGLLDSLPSLSGVVSVVLSSQFVRYGQVPWTDGVFAENDRQALAAGCFRAVHGEAVDRWRVVLDAPRYGCDNLAAAVDVALLDGLREIMARRHLRLTAVRPHLTAVFDRWRSQLAADDGGFALVEPGCVTTLLRHHAQWVDVANRRYRFAREAAQIIRQCVDANRMRGGSGVVAVLASGTTLETETSDNQVLRYLSGLGGPWPNDPWRSLAWSGA